ncbi:unnamed protein product [Aureobasidium pullulans]|nr:unnamed protein product [Aureobasidium pullulans]
MRIVKRLLLFAASQHAYHKKEVQSNIFNRIRYIHHSLPINPNHHKTPTLNKTWPNNKHSPRLPPPSSAAQSLNLVERIEEHAYYFLKELDFWLDRTQHPSTLEYQDILSLHPATLEQEIQNAAYMLSIEIELQEDIARMRASAYAQLDRIASAEKVCRDFLEVIGEGGSRDAGTAEMFETALEVLEDFREAILDRLRAADME